jgi:hypothetical protein
MASKLVDPTYPNLAMYISVFQTIKPTFSGHRVQRALIESDFVQLELDFIDFIGDITSTTGYMLLDRILSPYDQLTHDLALYLLQICLLSTTMQEYSIDQVACSCLYLARRLLNQVPYWPNYT